MCDPLWCRSRSKLCPGPCGLAEDRSTTGGADVVVDVVGVTDIVVDEDGMRWSPNVFLVVDGTAWLGGDVGINGTGGLWYCVAGMMMCGRAVVDVVDVENGVVLEVVVGDSETG